MDYGKFRFEASKKLQQSRKKQKQTQVKEIKFRPGTDIGDYKIKLRKLLEFLDVGDRVKVTLRFRGREMAHQELGMEMMDRLKVDLDEFAVVEQEPKMEGRLMVMVLAPKKHK
jgi:translation initiation factor IF-3